MTLESRAQQLINEFEAKDKLVTLSKEDTFEIDYDVATKFDPVKTEFNHKHKNSRVYMFDIESGRASLNKTNNFFKNLYEKMMNYF